MPYMPRMTNGVGTWFCKAHIDAGWGWDDAVECAMFLYFPVWHAAQVTAAGPTDALVVCSLLPTRD
jgi:hypothetical protein